jgi:hypothetical protein
MPPYADSKKTPAAELKVGQKVTFWVPENRRLPVVSR